MIIYSWNYPYYTMSSNKFASEELSDNLPENVESPDMADEGQGFMDYSFGFSSTGPSTLVNTEVESVDQSEGFVDHRNSLKRIPLVKSDNLTFVERLQLKPCKPCTIPAEKVGVLPEEYTYLLHSPEEAQASPKRFTVPGQIMTGTGVWINHLSRTIQTMAG